MDTDAAGRAREAGRRLLLAIDGLDEDSGTTAGPGRPSIAALLPRRPPPEVRVLVASRPHPPIPDDVAGDHPLEDQVNALLAESGLTARRRALSPLHREPPRAAQGHRWLTLPRLGG